MASSLSEMFNFPPEWSAFHQLVADIGDEASRLDIADVMTRIAPVFKAYAEATSPRKITLAQGGKHSQQFTTYYVLCKGLADRGTFAYRLVRTNSAQSLDVLDVDRLLADAELFKARSLDRRTEQLRALANNVGKRIEETVSQGLASVRRKLGANARWVESLHFLSDADPGLFQNMDRAHKAFTEQMIAALDDLTGGDRKKCDYLRPRLMAGLETLDRSRIEANAALLHAAKDDLDADAFSTIALNRSSITTTHYRWLTRDKSPQHLPFRRAFAKACPIFLLSDNFREEFSFFERGPVHTDVNHAINTIFRCWTQPQEAAFYRTLREDVVGAENARHLLDIADYVKSWRDAGMTLERREDWNRLSMLVVAAQDYAFALNHKTEDMFAEIAREIQNDPDFISTDRATRKRDIEDISILRNRIVLGLAPKLVLEAQFRGFDLPVSHALFLAGGPRMVSRDALARMPREMVKPGNAAQKQAYLADIALLGTSIRDFREKAFAYNTQHGEDDRLLRDLIITNRLAERAADYPWHPLPLVEMSEDHYTMVPLTSAADVSKVRNSSRIDLWDLIPQAIRNGTHFVAMRRRGGITDAVAVIEEPETENDHWQLADVVRSSSHPQRNTLEEIAKAYLCTPEFLDTVDLAAIRARRAQLYATLSTRASDNEMLGLSSMRDLEERRLRLQILARYWPAPAGFEIDEHGCMSMRDLDAFTARQLDMIAAHYPRKRSSYGLPGPPPPEIG